MKKRFLLMTGFVISTFGISGTQAQVLHKVSVIDHAFEPRSLRISEGDTVRWEWKGDLHNVVAVTIPGGGVKSGAFESELLNTNASFEVEFSRELLNQYSRDSGAFEYVCEPHAFFGMHGSVSVERVVKEFIGTASAWQAGGEGFEEFNVQAELSGNERTLALRLPGAEKPMSFELRTGGIGETGEAVCSGSIHPGAAASCAIDDSNELFQGNMFVTLDSRLRAQLVRQGLRGAISGRVRNSDGLVTSGVTVSAGDYSVQSDAMGNYRLDNLPFGVYRVSASYGGIRFREVGWSNPTLLITTEVYRRDFETSSGVPGSTPVPTTTMGDVCTAIKQRLSILSSTIHDSFDLGIQYISDNSLLDFLHSQNVRVFAKVARGTVFEDTDRDGILKVSMGQGKGSAEFEVVNDAGDIVCREQLSVVIDSPLNAKNLYKVKHHLVQATVNSRRGVPDQGYLNKALALLLEMSSGGAKHPRYPEVLNRRVLSGFATSLSRIRRTPERRMQKLAKLLERVAMSIELLEEKNRIQPVGHLAHRSGN